MPTEMAPRVEIYVRFQTPTGQTGIYESPCATTEEAAGLFVDDDDIVSASMMAICPKGMIESVEDITVDVINVLQDRIDNGDFEKCPHPFMEDAFKTWWESDPARAKAERDAQKADDAYEEARLEEPGF
jgi:hypothetical protein